MKMKFLFLVLFAFIMSAYGQKKTLNIEGTWKLVQNQSISDNKAVTVFPGKAVIDEIKIWSGNNFMFVARNKTDTIAQDYYGTGTYKLDGNRYEEYLVMMSYKPWEGETIKMTMEMKNDTLIQTFPVDDKGQMNKDWASIEKYVRIKK